MTLTSALSVRAVITKLLKCPPIINRSFRAGMNEWSPQGYYSGSTAVDVPPQIVPCHAWQEHWGQEKSTSLKAMNNGRVGDYQKPSDVVNEFLNEEIGISPTNSSKKKKSGASDPRFKRVISTEFRDVADSETKKLASKVKMSTAPNQGGRDQDLNEKLLSFLKTPNDCAIFKTSNLKCLMDQKQRELSAEVTKDTGFQLPDKYFLNNNPKEYSYNNIQRDSNEVPSDAVEQSKNCFKTSLKRSASDCTMKTKVPFEENESSEHIRGYPSAIKLSDANNWMKKQKVLPEKRRSVITVIGQTQTKPFSQILSEIHQRRKLAKELDKHALCEALMTSMENHSELKNVVAKVDLVLPDGKVIYSTEKVYMCKDNELQDSIYSPKSLEILDSGDAKRKRCDMIPERDSSGSQLGKKKSKRLSKKLVSPVNEKFKVKDSIRSIFEYVSPAVFWLLLAFLCFGLCFSIFFHTVRTPQTYYILKFFKPKTAAWYEKLLF